MQFIRLYHDSPAPRLRPVASCHWHRRGVTQSASHHGPKPIFAALPPLGPGRARFGPLGTGWVPARFVRGGANWLIADMLLFFVPAVMAAREHRELLGALGVKLGIVIVVSTLCVMAGTAWLVALSQAWSARGRREAAA